MGSMTRMPLPTGGGQSFSPFQGMAAPNPTQGMASPAYQQQPMPSPQMPQAAPMGTPNGVMGRAMAQAGMFPQQGASGGFPAQGVPPQGLPQGFPRPLGAGFQPPWSQRVSNMLMQPGQMQGGQVNEGI